MNPLRKSALRLTAILLMATSLTACGNTFERLSGLGQEPKITPIQNPGEVQPIVHMPMPAPITAERAPNSLWRPGARAFLKDQRAGQVGDIVTVVINRTDGIDWSNETTRTRTNTEKAGTTKLLGYENTLWNKLPGSQGPITPATLLDLNSNLSNDGLGTLKRSDKVDMRIAAVVTQVLPNGNLVIRGSQEVRANFETRVFQVAGVIRPADILSTNEVNHDKIAEARFAYGGRGQLSDMQQPRWGSQVLDILMPF
jgi:flagellar L-ring protein precursor FlgH